MNKLGGYSCPCKAGFQFTGNECLGNAKTICMNALGGYSCPCKAGFQLTGNECLGKIYVYLTLRRSV